MWKGTLSMHKAKIRRIEPGEAVNCPTCGKAITIVEPEYTYFADPLCEHVRFIFNVDEFAYIEPELKTKLDAEEAQAEEREEDFDPWEALKVHTGPDSIIISQTEEGMACGPVSSTVWIGVRSPKGSFKRAGGQPQRRREACSTRKVVGGNDARAGREPDKDRTDAKRDGAKPTHPDSHGA
jgi:hypothetical protein